MIDYGQFQFSSPPRTATTWFMRAAFVAGFGVGQKAAVHTPPPTGGYSLMVSMARHPYDWLDSYYHEFKGGFCGVAEVDALVLLVRKSTSFERFLKLYVKYKTGFLGDLSRLYKADTVMRVEDLPWAAVELFQSLDVPAKRLQEIAMTAPMNRRLVRYNDNGSHGPWRRAVCEAEADYCERFEYDHWRLR